jgi:hypothetical protein
MNRAVILIFLSLVVACDTKDSVEPRYRNFFVKFIGSEGNQFGNDVIQTSDGGYVIVGRTEDVAAGSANMLIIKTDSLGNTQWMIPNSSIQTTMDLSGEAYSVIQTADGSLIVGGIRGLPVGSDTRSVILKFAADGTYIDQTTFAADDERNELSKITYTRNNEILVAGSTSHQIPGDPVNENGFLLLLRDSDLSPVRDPKYFGREGNDFVAGAYATELVGADSIFYLAFGHFDQGDLTNPTTVYWVGFDRTWSDFAAVQNPFPSSTGNQVANDIVVNNDVYSIVGTSNATIDQLFQTRLEASNTNPATDIDWLFNGTYSTINSGEKIQGISIDVSSTGVTIIGGNIDKNASENTEILLSKTSRTSFIWQRIFGTDSDNQVGAVMFDRSGSLITVGTVDLESQFKVVLIKTGPNGEMSF